jgi:Fic family protein
MAYSMRWSCSECGKSGETNGESMWRCRLGVVSAHRQAAPDCADEHGIMRCSSKPGEGDWPQASHSDDPDTSKAAERHVTESGSRSAHANIVRHELLKEPTGLTAPEIAERTELEEYQVRRRLTDLRKTGLVSRTFETREWPKTGRQQSVWVPVVKGET